MRSHQLLQTHGTVARLEGSESFWNQLLQMSNVLEPVACMPCIKTGITVYLHNAAYICRSRLKSLFWKIVLLWNLATCLGTVMALQLSLHVARHPCRWKWHQSVGSGTSPACLGAKKVVNPGDSLSRVPGWGDSRMVSVSCLCPDNTKRTHVQRS